MFELNINPTTNFLSSNINCGCCKNQSVHYYLIMMFILKSLSNVYTLKYNTTKLSKVFEKAVFRMHLNGSVGFVKIGDDYYMGTVSDPIYDFNQELIACKLTLTSTRRTLVKNTIRYDWIDKIKEIKDNFIPQQDEKTDKNKSDDQILIDATPALYLQNFNNMPELCDKSHLITQAVSAYRAYEINTENSKIKQIVTLKNATNKQIMNYAHNWTERLTNYGTLIMGCNADASNMIETKTNDLKNQQEDVANNYTYAINLILMYSGILHNRVFKKERKVVSEVETDNSIFTLISNSLYERLTNFVGDWDLWTGEKNTLSRAYITTSSDADLKREQEILTSLTNRGIQEDDIGAVGSDNERLWNRDVRGV